jgi:hypothetical protein
MTDRFDRRLEILVGNQDSSPQGKSHHRTVSAFVMTAVFLCLGLSGCAARQVKADFAGFENAYAETSNREVLLNLARLENHDPTYFFKLGQISESYRLQATLTGTGNITPQGTIPGGALVTGGGAGAPGLVYESNPAFTFIPVNDDTNAQLMLKPIPAETFYALFQQGWRLDQLFRLMVDRIELTSTRGNPTVCITETIRNTPDDVGAYVRFLRVSAILYFLQKRGYLLLRGGNEFVPYDEKSFLPNSAPVETTEGSNKAVTTPITNQAAGAGNPQKANGAMTASDFNQAWAKNSVWEQVKEEGPQKGMWRLGQEVFTPVFKLNPPFGDCSESAKKISEDDALCPHIEIIENQLEHDQDLDLQDIHEKLKPIPDLLPFALGGLLKGFSIESNGPQAHSAQLPCQQVPSSKDGEVQQIHLVLRSLIGVMAAAAQEQDQFDRLKSTTTYVPPDPLLDKKDNQSGFTFESAVPQVEQLPLLRLKWTPGNNNPTQSLIPPLNYKGNMYAVMDPGNPSVPGNKYWNRDMFRLISQLSAQVTIDISKFPLPEVLQLRTQ